MNRLFIIGAGGHSRVVIECAVQNNYKIEGIIDINYQNTPEKILNNDVIGNLDALEGMLDINVFIALGDNEERKVVHEHCSSKGFKIVNLIHPNAIVSNTETTFGEGIYIGSGAIINPCVSINNGTIINTGAIVEHEVTIGSFSHIAPGTKIAGRVSVGDLSFLGIGSCIIDKVKIGSNVTVGAGSVVTKDINNNLTVVGVNKITS